MWWLVIVGVVVAAVLFAIRQNAEPATSAAAKSEEYARAKLAAMVVDVRGDIDRVTQLVRSAENGATDQYKDVVDRLAKGTAIAHAAAESLDSRVDTEWLLWLRSQWAQQHQRISDLSSDLGKERRSRIPSESTPPQA